MQCGVPGAVLSHVGAFVTLAVVCALAGREEAGRLAGDAVQVRLQGIGDVVPASCRVRALRWCRKVSVFRSAPGVMVVVEAGYVVLVAGSAAMTDRSRCWRPVVLAAHRVGL